MMAYQPGSPCDDCLSNGIQNYLKPFYINLEEQIIKCESSRCMFPFIRKPVCNDFIDLKADNVVQSLDEFIEESAKKIDDNLLKSETNICPTKTEHIPIMFDYSSVFMDNFCKEEKAKPMMTNYAITDSCKIVSDGIKNELQLNSQSQAPPKARISRCLSDVKNLKKSNLKSKSKRGKVGTVLVVEPQTGKHMRPLDLIKQYMKF